MVQVAMVLVAVPFGFYLRTRTSAMLATGAVFVITSIPQVLTTPQRVEVAYWVVQVLTAVIAYGLVRLGWRLGQSRRVRVAD